MAAVSFEAARYRRVTSRAGPSSFSLPWSSSTARWQRAWIAAMLWLTNSTVRRSRLDDILHLSEALLLKARVADREHLVDDEDLRLEVRGDGEGQPHVHAARVALHRRVDELLDLGERDDLVELPADFRLAHAEDRAVQKDVLPAGQLGVKTGADLEQARHAPAQGDLAGRRRGDPRQDLQQRRFAGAVAADDADDLARAERRTTRLGAPRTPSSRSCSGSTPGRARGATGAPLPP